MKTQNKTKLLRYYVSHVPFTTLITFFLGGVFIAMLAGLGLAILTLMGEVIYHRRKLMPLKRTTSKTRLRKPSMVKKSEPKKEPPQEKKEPVSILKKDPSEKSIAAKKSVTLGDKDGFESKTGLPKVSYITVYPKQ